MPTPKQHRDWKISEGKSRVVYVSNGKEWRGTEANAKKIARALRHLTTDDGPGIFGRACTYWEASQGRGKYVGRRYEKLDYWIVEQVMCI